ncbi:hypothetical protein G7Y89_g15233 [Cudoniella acicularis]|uniref:Uncharacterized protein n=1 Tax=Cudoniella acicularis TaxID=354080 RepID=A0A8H4VNA2_9HELO|nr:hypothetical protein G7Y89_g15233 [Cudoniella acicularis]
MGEQHAQPSVRHILGLQEQILEDARNATPRAAPTPAPTAVVESFGHDGCCSAEVPAPDAGLVTTAVTAALASPATPVWLEAVGVGNMIFPISVVIKEPELQQSLPPGGRQH